MNTALIPLVDKLKHAKIICLGDIMLDVYISGSVPRISPEAPVPVLIPEKRQEMAGGIGNVYKNLKSLGTDTRLISVMGDDENGQKIKDLCPDQNLIIDASRPTTTKTRFLNKNTHIMRLDEESTEGIDASVEDQILNKLENYISNYQILVLSDYKKGVLTSSLLKHILNLAEQKDVKVLIDPKGTDYSAYTGAYAITPNLKNLHDATNLSVESDTEIEKAARSLIEKFDFNYVVVTRSENGMSLVSQDHDMVSIPAATSRAVEVSGAGDTVMATLAAALSIGADMKDAMILSNLAASCVIEEAGSCVITPEKLIERLR